jgi:hypothetical protein
VEPERVWAVIGRLRSAHDTDADIMRICDELGRMLLAEIKRMSQPPVECEACAQRRAATAQYRGKRTGRPPKGQRAMTEAERQRAYRERKRERANDADSPQRADHPGGPVAV